MHQIASYLQEYDCYFSQFYSEDFMVKAALWLGLLESTILSGQFKRTADKYLADNNLKNDYARGNYGNRYDLIVVCSDLLIPKSILNAKTIWVQEGMTDKLTAWGRLVRKLRWPRYLSGGTSLNGTSNCCDVYCAASIGYKKHFSALGTDEDKIMVTGIPNFDNVKSFLNNSFPYKAYVLVATSDIRETFGWENRKIFIEQAVKIANGRQLIFKLHPNEKVKRAIAEIRQHTHTNTLVFSEGNINHMIANCDELITQYSTVVYVGMALGKKVHSYFEFEKLRELMPIQNGGTSAQRIAQICKRYIEHSGTPEGFRKHLLQEDEPYPLIPSNNSVEVVKGKDRIIERELIEK